MKSHTVFLFQDCNGKYIRIYAFEPDNHSYQYIVSVLERRTIHNVEVVNKGCWYEATTLGFSCNTDTRGTSVIDTQGSDVVEVTAIDDAVGGDALTFIKMDIEGAELEALHGAVETIKKYKPRLAISVYHKPSDIVDIPAYILSLVPEYKLYIRQYSYFLGETVLYAVL